MGINGSHGGRRGPATPSPQAGLWEPRAGVFVETQGVFQMGEAGQTLNRSSLSTLTLFGSFYGPQPNHQIACACWKQVQ